MSALPNQTCYSLLQPHCLVSRGKNKLILANCEISLVWMPAACRTASTFFPRFNKDLNHCVAQEEDREASCIYPSVDVCLVRGPRGGVIARKEPKCCPQ